MIISDIESKAQLTNLYAHVYDTCDAYQKGNFSCRLKILEQILQPDGVNIIRHYDRYNQVQDFSYEFTDEAAYTFFLLKWS